MLTQPISKVRSKSRRHILAGGLACAFLPRIARANAEARTLTFHNLHTGESLQTEYWAGGAYLTEAAGQISWILRDFRNNTIHTIEPRLLDLLHRLQSRIETSRPFEVISGYRSPQTNAALAAVSNGVAKHSLHMSGMAIDIRVGGIALASLRAAALSLQMGGVGYYPQSDFVHVDVGRIRTW